MHHLPHADCKKIYVYCSLRSTQKIISNESILLFSAYRLRFRFLRFFFSSAQFFFSWFHILWLIIIFQLWLKVISINQAKIRYNFHLLPFSHQKVHHSTDSCALTKSKSSHIKIHFKISSMTWIFARVYLVLEGWRSTSVGNKLHFKSKWC